MYYTALHILFSRIICNFHRARNLAYGHEVVSWENTVTNICLHSISFYVHCLYWYYYYIESPSGDIKFGGKVQYGVVQCHCLLYKLSKISEFFQFRREKKNQNLFLGNLYATHLFLEHCARNVILDYCFFFTFRII